VGTSLGRRDSYLSLAVRFALWRVARWGFYIVARLPKRTPSDEEKAPRLHAELWAGRHSGLRGYLSLPRSRQASNSTHWTKFLSAPDSWRREAAGRSTGKIGQVLSNLIAIRERSPAPLHDQKFLFHFWISLSGGLPRAIARVPVALADFRTQIVQHVALLSRNRRERKSVSQPPTPTGRNR